MKRINWRVVGGVLIVLALIGWLSSLFEWVEETVPGVVKGEARRDPFFAARLYTERLGYPTQAINDPTQLAGQATSATIVALQRFPTVVARRMEPQLLDWVRSGGHLVIQNGQMSEDFKSAIGMQAIGMFSVEAEPKKGKLPPQQVEVEGRRLTVSLPYCEVFSLKQTPEWSATLTGYRPYSTTCPAGAGTDEESEEEMDEDSGDAPADDAQEKKVSSVPALAMARWRVGKGMVTALCSSTPLNNRYIGEHQNAELATRALLDGRGGAFVFAPRPEFPTLPEWIMDKAWAVALSASVLLVIGIWNVVPRFGAIAPAPAPQRPGLRDHLRAVAGFHLRKHHFDALLQASREHCRRLMERHTGSDAPDLVEIAAFAGVDAGDLRDALHTQPRHRADYLRMSSILAATNDALQSARTLSFPPNSRLKKS